MSAILNRYPLWRYGVLFLILLIGLIYAIPNFFSEIPAIEISQNEIGEVINPSAFELIIKTLKKYEIVYKSVELENTKIVVRLNHLDDQLKAKERLESELGPAYSVAVNLVAATPKFLRWIGAVPMKLGLDLRGGVHFLLQVDVESAIQSKLQSDIRAISDELKNKNIRYAGIKIKKPDIILFKFHSSDIQAHAENIISIRFSDYSVETLQEDQDQFLQLHLTPAAATNLKNTILSQIIQILNNRINALGVAESIVTRQGLDRISVDLPGVQDTAQARQILGGNATLEMHLVDETADVQKAEQGTIPDGDSLYPMRGGYSIVLKNQVVLTGDSITSAVTGFDQNGQPAVNIRATGPQINQFHLITGQNVGKRMAIVLVNINNRPEIINGQTVNQVQKTKMVISAPVINSALGGDFQITGLGTAQMAQNLAIQLRSGTTPVNMYPIQELLVGPSLGKTNILYGLISVIVGFSIIVLFMVFYYRLFGFIASLALATDLILIIALMSIIGFTLSLPGMAAMVLTVGIAVDANVLIFERIREELRNGTTVQAAIHAGYERAFATIFDANVTNLIVACILFILATGVVKAFAITFIIGLLTSMFTATTGTRALVNWIYGNKNIKKLSIGI